MSWFEGLSQDSLWAGCVLLPAWPCDEQLQVSLSVLFEPQKRPCPGESASPAGAFPWFPTGRWVWRDPQRGWRRGTWKRARTKCSGRTVLQMTKLFHDWGLKIGLRDSLEVCRCDGDLDKVRQRGPSTQLPYVRDVFWLKGGQQNVPLFSPQCFQHRTSTSHTLDCVITFLGLVNVCKTFLLCCVLWHVFQRCIPVPKLA